MGHENLFCYVQTMKKPLKFHGSLNGILMGLKKPHEFNTKIFMVINFMGF